MNRWLQHDPWPFGLVSASAAMGWCFVGLVSPETFDSGLRHRLHGSAGAELVTVIMGLFSLIQGATIIYGGNGIRRVMCSLSAMLWLFIALSMLIAGWPVIGTAVTTYAVIAASQMLSIIMLEQRRGVYH